MSGEEIHFGTVVPFSWYRGCTSVAASHFSEMAREGSNAVRIDVSEEDLVMRMQEVAAVVQLASAARLKPVVGVCGMAGILGIGALSRTDAERSPFLQAHQHALKVDGCGVPCSGQVCPRNLEFIDYACALCCAVGCMRGVAGLSLVHPSFSPCFCSVCTGDINEGEAQSDASKNRFRYKRRMPVLPDEDDERVGPLLSSASAALHLLHAMFLSFRSAPSLARSSSASAFFGGSLMKTGAADLARAMRVLELSPQPSVMQPAAEMLLGGVPSATHIIMPLPYTVLPHDQLRASPLTSSLSSPERKYKVHPRSAAGALPSDVRAGDGQEERPVSDGCCWDAIAIFVETNRKWLESSLVKVTIDTARQRKCKVGLSIAAGKPGRISVLSIDSIRPSEVVVAAPLQARNSFVRTAAQQQQPLVKSREERSSRQMLMKQPLVYDLLLLRLLLPHIDALAPPQGLFLNTRSTFITDPSVFPQMLEDALQPQLVWLGQFRGGDGSCFDGAVAAADSRLSIGSLVHASCDCCRKNLSVGDENEHLAAQHDSHVHLSVVPAVYAELGVSNTLKNAQSYSLHTAACYEPCAFHKRVLAFFSDAFLGTTAARGMLVDSDLDKMTSGVMAEEEPSLLAEFLKRLGFDQPKKKSLGAGGKSEQYVDDGQENTASGGIAGFFSGIANSVSTAVTAVAAAVVGGAAEHDEHKYLDDEAVDLHLEEDDDARDKCCYCIPTAPKDQVKYIACVHKLSEYCKGDDGDPDVYLDKSERCEQSTRAHLDFWKSLQRINQTEPLPFGAPDADAAKRREVELKWMPSALGFNRYIARRKQLMNRKRCSLKKGLREGTAKLLVQPPEPDMDLVMLLVTLVGMASYVYLLYTQIAIVISSFALQDYTLLFCFVVKESFFVTYLGVWILLKIIIPIAVLPIILLVKIATSASSSYQQQKLRITFLNVVVPLYNDQVDVLLMMTTSLSSIYLLLQYINKIRQKELNPGIKDFDEKIQIIANLTFSLVIALFQPDKLNEQQRISIMVTLASIIRQMAFEKNILFLHYQALKDLNENRYSKFEFALYVQKLLEFFLTDDVAFNYVEHFYSDERFRPGFLPYRPGEHPEADRDMDWMQAQVEEVSRLRTNDMNAAV